MEQSGFVMHLHEEQRYGLGVAAFELSSAYSRQEPLSRLGRPLLATLVDKIGESAHLAVLHGRDVLYIVEERAKHRPSLVTDVGVRLPSHLTASGRAILAALPKSQVRALYPNAAAFSSRTEVPDPIGKYSTLSAAPGPGAAARLLHRERRGHRRLRLRGCRRDRPPWLARGCRGRDIPGGKGARRAVAGPGRAGHKGGGGAVHPDLRAPRGLTAGRRTGCGGSC